jgi:hypothetical protein
VPSFRTSSKIWIRNGSDLPICLMQPHGIILDDLLQTPIVTPQNVVDFFRLLSYVGNMKHVGAINSAELQC